DCLRQQELHSTAIGSDPSRCGLPARNPPIKAQFLDNVQRKTEQFAKWQHVATDSYPSKQRSEHKKQSAQRRNDKAGRRRTQQKSHAAEELAKRCDKHKQRQRRHRHVDGERSQTKVSIAQRFDQRHWNQIDNIVEMTLLPTLSLLFAASLRYREITVDPRLAREKWRIALRGEGNPQGRLFRQPPASQCATQDEAEAAGHPCTDELSW